MKNTIITFTRNQLQEIKAKGCDYSWILNKQRAEKCKYLVCCRSEGAKRRDAFLVALISGIRQVDDDAKGNHRWAIDIYEYANIDIPNVWEGWQNPVHYTSLEQLKIDLSTINFEKLQESKGNDTLPLTIEQAKQALAKSFNLNTEQIEILIKG
ncbi:MAG: hypothetical protein ACRC1Z_13600 [Waterburya sp.]